MSKPTISSKLKVGQIVNPNKFQIIVKNLIIWFGRRWRWQRGNWWCWTWYRFIVFLRDHLVLWWHPVVPFPMAGGVATVGEPFLDSSNWLSEAARVSSGSTSAVSFDCGVALVYNYRWHRSVWDRTLLLYVHAWLSININCSLSGMPWVENVIPLTWNKNKLDTSSHLCSLCHLHVRA